MKDFLPEAINYNPTFGRDAFERNLGVMHFKGGGAPSPPAAPVPPPTEKKVEVRQAQREARYQSLRRKGLRSTILAGTKDEESTIGKRRTLLGGNA